LENQENSKRSAGKAIDKLRESESRAEDLKKVEGIRESLVIKPPTKKEYKEYLREAIHTENLEKELAELLQNFRKKGEATSLETFPMICEATIEIMIENGFSTPKTILFFLLTGIAEGYLGDRQMKELLPYSAQFPVLGFIAKEDGSFIGKEEALALAKKNFNGSYKSGKPGADFQSFYWKTVVNEKGVVEAGKSVDPNAVDQDHAMEMAAVIGPSGIQKMFDPRDVQSANAIQNIYAGLLMWFEENREKVFDEPKAFAQKLALFVSLDRLAKNNVTVRDGNLKPREAHETHHPDSTVGEIREMLWGAIENLDKGLFGILKDFNDSKFETLQKRFSKYGVAVKTIDEAYEKIGEVVGKMIRPGAFSRIIGKYSRFSKKLKAA
jgi:hypothetical protein